MVKVLTEELLYAHCKVPLPDVQVVDIRRLALDRLASLERCRSLRTLIAAGNSIKEVTADIVGECRELWKLDLRDNMVTDLGGLVLFPALGHLYLSGNRITYEELSTLGGVHVMELRLENNRGLTTTEGGSDPAQYRRNVLFLMPHVWVLDGVFVTAEERAAVAAYFSDGSSDRSPDDDTADGDGDGGGGGGGGGGEPGPGAGSPLRELAKRRVEETKQRWVGPHVAGKLAVVLRKAETDAPARPRLSDAYRLKHLTHLYSLDAALQNDYYRRMTHFLPGGLPSLVLGELHLVALAALPHRVRLDLTVTIAATLGYAVRPAIVEDAMTVLLAGVVGGDVPASRIAKDLSILPHFAVTVAVYFLGELCGGELEEREKRGEGGDRGVHARRLERILCDSLPRVGRGGHVGAAANYSEDHERAGNAPMMLRHAVHVLSRSPAFPGLNLLQHPSSLAPAAKAVYEEVRPLLDAAGYGSLALDDTGDAANASVRQRMPWKNPNFDPQRGYRRPWAGEAAKGGGEAEDAGGGGAGLATAAANLYREAHLHDPSVRIDDASR